MDALLELMATFVGHWRAALVTVSALVAALVLAYLFSSFTGGIGIGLVLLGLAGGMLWEANALRRQRSKGDRSDVQQS